MQLVIALCPYTFKKLLVGERISEQFIKAKAGNYIEPTVQLCALRSGYRIPEQHTVCRKILYYVTNIDNIASAVIISVNNSVHSSGELLRIVGEVRFSLLVQIIILHIYYNQRALHIINVSYAIFRSPHGQ